MVPLALLLAGPQSQFPAAVERFLLAKDRGAIAVRRRASASDPRHASHDCFEAQNRQIWSSGTLTNDLGTHAPSRALGVELAGCSH